MAKGVAGLLHDATRPGRKKPLPAATIEQVVAMTLDGPPDEATHWTGRAMANRNYQDRGWYRAHLKSIDKGNPDDEEE
jgi:hypothetical protein